MNWEPWTGCHQISDGCANCYFYGPYAKRYGQNTILKTDQFDWPIRRNKKGEYNIKGNKILATCFATDFFLPEADEWRGEVWAMIRERTDIDFLILTKRIDRFPVSLPADWGEGYDNVNIGCTVENQALADYRLPLFLSYPMKRRFIACAPLLEAIDLTPYLHGVDHVTAGGETGRAARECDYEWVLNIREQCAGAGVTFWFKNTGSRFRRDGVVEKSIRINRPGWRKRLGLIFQTGKGCFECLGQEGTMLELRLLRDEDLPLVEVWLNQEHVKKWYEIPRLGLSINDWLYELRERNGEFKWLTHLVVLWQGRPIGLCQYYKCEDSRDEDFGSLPIEGAYGIDYLIGEETCLGKGLGKEMVTSLVDLVFSFPDAKRVTADIDKENKASERTLLSCGFTLFDAECSRYVLTHKSNNITE